METEIITKAGKETWNILKSSYKRLFIDLLKIQIIVAAIMIIVGVLGLAVIYGIGYAPDIAKIPLWVLVALVFLVGIFLSAVGASVGYNVVDSTIKRRELSFERNFKANLGPMFRYILVTIGINIVIFLPLATVVLLLAIGVSIFGGPMGGIIVVLIRILFEIMISVIAAIVYLFTQFAIFELLIGRNGAIESYKKGFHIVKKKFLETVVFSFALWAVEIAISIPLILMVICLLALLGAGAILAMWLLALEMTVVWAAAAVAVFVLVILAFIFTAIKTAIMYSAQYVYWNKIRK
jgi:hypothetical protein